ncbi:hypothetical protein PHMEG_00010072 [Phytophthora megakarya]|uniref:DUF659 domain-containing protein n=1 Tax=Phytophthora megakarya TaxID=4795 RepID=A0A225WEL2_9STRA|nr:hypothetical protein PHMEG_00010072 [Phytophthora megakarya]
MRHSVINLINEQVYVSLVTDGWSDHTAAYLAGEIDKVIAEIQHETTTRVVAVVTDNAQNMRSASGRIPFQRPNTVNGGCSAHVLHLLMQDVCRFPAIRAIQTRAVALTRFSFQHGMRELGSKTRTLVLPVPTRWYSVFTCLRNVVNSQEILENYFLVLTTRHFVVAIGLQHPPERNYAT